MTLTKDEARKIADIFLEAAQAVDKYLDNNFNNITRDEYEFLYENFKTLIRGATSATTVAVGLAINDMEEPAQKITGVIKKAKSKIETLDKVGSVICIASGLADLAAGIIAKDPGAIISSIKNLDTVISNS